jgi:hypothetical protein
MRLPPSAGSRRTRSVEIAKAVAVAGCDWLFLDMEHGVMPLKPARRYRPPRSRRHCANRPRAQL